MKLTIEIENVCKCFGHDRTPEDVAKALREIAKEMDDWDYFTEGDMVFSIGCLKVTLRGQQ